jgi:predicted RNase H-like HicB family nuclease
MRMPRKNQPNVNVSVDPARYPVEVFYSEEDAGYIAIAKDLSGCSAYGKTQAKAIAAISDAIKAWMQAAAAAGNPIPEPTGHSVEAPPSGKLLLRIPRSLHASLIDSAKKEGVSLNQHLVSILSLNVGALLLLEVRGGAVRSAFTAASTVNANVGAVAFPTLINLKAPPHVNKVGQYTSFTLSPSEQWQLVSAGETVVWPRSSLNVRMLPAGQPVLIEDQ